LESPAFDSGELPANFGGAGDTDHDGCHRGTSPRLSGASRPIGDGAIHSVADSARPMRTILPHPWLVVIVPAMPDVAAFRITA
jgi:hypothetical protein